jgi:hypothetical protein
MLGKEQGEKLYCIIAGSAVFVASERFSFREAESQATRYA